MTRPLSSRPVRAASVLAMALALAVPASTLAHAEFERSTPEDGETVQGSPNVIRAFFSEELADGSEMALLDESGATVAEGTIDPANPTRMRIDPPELEPGDYEVQWKAFADDGHLETGTFTFTVSAPITPVPSIEPTESPPETVAPSASVAPSAPPPVTPSPTQPTATPEAEPAGSTETLLPIVAAVVLVGVLGGYLLLRRRPSDT